MEATVQSWETMPDGMRKWEALQRWELNAIFVVFAFGLWFIKGIGAPNWLGSVIFVLLVIGFASGQAYLRDLTVGGSISRRLKQIRPRGAESVQTKLKIRQGGVQTGQDEGWFACDHQGLEFVGLRSRVLVPRHCIKQVKLQPDLFVTRLLCEIDLPSYRTTVALEFTESGFGVTRLKEIVQPHKLVRSTNSKEYDDIVAIPLGLQERFRFDRRLFVNEIASAATFATIFLLYTSLQGADSKGSVAELAATWLITTIVLTAFLSFRNLYRGFLTRGREFPVGDRR